MAAIDQIVCYYGIGAGADASRRFVQFVQPARGWAGFVADHITPMMQLGLRRFMLWMPHGREATARQQLVGNVWRSTLLRHDAWRVASQNAALSWLTAGFAEAMYPLTTSGIEIIAYVGTLHGAPEFDSLPAGQAKWEAAMAIAPLLDARCSIGLDTSFASKPGHYVYDLAQMLKNAGYKYYLEPTPYADGQHWFSSPCVVSDAQWTAVSNPGNWGVLAAPSKLTGEIVRGWFGAVPTGYAHLKEWYQATVPTAIAQGYTCCLPLKTYLLFGGTIPQLLG